jgi:hypothetical protein
MKREGVAAMYEEYIIAISEDKTTIIVALETDEETAERELRAYKVPAEEIADITDEGGEINIRRLMAEYEPEDVEIIDIPSSDEVLDKYDDGDYNAADGAPRPALTGGWGFPAPWDGGGVTCAKWGDVFCTLEELADDLGEELKISDDEPETEAELAALTAEQKRLFGILDDRKKYSESYYDWGNPKLGRQTAQFCERYELNPKKEAV